MTGGVFGACTKGDCVKCLYQGTLSLQHRGQEYCGLAVHNNGMHIRTHRGQVIPGFSSDLAGFSGNIGIGHTSSIDRQPITKYSQLGEMTLGFDGYITNSDSLRQNLLAENFVFSTLEDIELIATLIGKNHPYRVSIPEVLRKIHGPCSMVILTDHGVYAARDVHGMQPLIIGRSEEGYFVASESCAFSLIPDIKIVGDVSPGELVLLEPDKMTSLEVIVAAKTKMCSFEWIYFARPDSIIDGKSVTLARHNLGGLLATADNVEADLVAPVPFSGICHAEGYHYGSGIPYGQALLLPRYLQRTYIMPLEARENERARKLIPIKEFVKGKRIILVDDSIRSSITMAGLVDDLRQAGASEVHVRIASPPSIRYCPYAKLPLEKENYIARNHSVEEIRKTVNADTLRFQNLENVAKAIGIPEQDLCLDCFLQD